MVHLAIDVQRTFLRSLGKARQETFPISERQFADKLWLYGIPTIWVAIGIDHEYYRLYSDQSEIINKVPLLGIEALAPKESEMIMIKRREDAFFLPVLTNYFEQNQITDPIFTGMKTKACITETIKGALRQKLNCHVICDQLADPDEPTEQVSMFEWHRNALQSALPDPSNIAYYKNEEFLSLIQKGPMHPLTNASVPNGRKLIFV